ncbi:MAG TPA: metallopeptidase family protein [Thermomicrobiales bacterium]|nr:metallopeptidase family protein [Thermomicrobiales bacterium]
MQEALRSLPPEVESLVQNLAIVIEDEPSQRSFPEDDLAADEVFGFYEGTPHLDRGHTYGMTTPDKVTIYRGPHERACSTSEELKHEVRMTLIHELAHHVGFDEDRIAAKGWA